MQNYLQLFEGIFFADTGLNYLLALRLVTTASSGHYKKIPAVTTQRTNN